jgi:eukaryotic-like serine/threonine-protein kinase
VAPSWLARAVSAAVGAIGLRDDRTHTVSASPAPADTPVPERIGRYRVERRLGRGGMGVVYAGRDERLDRPVALKLIGADAPGEEERRRFAREARAAARVNHPHVCQVYEVDEHAGQPFIAMELLAGEALSDRLAAGPVLPGDAVAWTLQVLDALQALHAQSLVHRDLKPSNVFLGPHGVKVLDFGLAREVESVVDSGAGPITRTGAVMGTPRYMAPEQVYGHEADARTDLFAAGAILFEMLAGRPAFPGRTAVEVLYATLHEHPPALAGSAIVVALDRVVRRALAKAPDDRYPSAELMAADLRAVPAGDAGVARAQALTRLIVLPFRVLRADPETDFLSLGLAEAIASSLSGCPPLVVRSSLLGQRFAGEALDLKRLAAEADVDRAITGTLLRSGDDLRVGAQLLEVPSGTVLWSHTATVPAGDVFGIQDDLAGRVLASVVPADVPAARAPRRDVPRTARAYEFYLRANEVGRDYVQLPVARDLYRECLEEDPGYAPAWARLGRALRVIGKYLGEPGANLVQAEEAFTRALALNPELGIAHKYSAHHEAESGSVGEALARLLARARVDRNDPEIFGALVHACRYAGLQEESLAAHEEALRLDPNASTSVAFTLWALGDYAALADGRSDVIDQHPRTLALLCLGRPAEARSVILSAGARTSLALMRDMLEQTLALVDGRDADALRLCDEMLPRFADPEGRVLQACVLARLGQPERALQLLEASVNGGFYGVAALPDHPWLASLRDDPAFGRVLRRAAAHTDELRRAFADAGGVTLLGVRR